MRTRQEYLALFRGPEVYDVTVTGTLGDETRTVTVHGIRADREGQANTRAMLILTAPDGAFSDTAWSGYGVTYVTVPHDDSEDALMDATVERMKAEIRHDVSKGLVPPTVATFSELHDYVDANEYGGLCEDDCPDEFDFSRAGLARINTMTGRVDEWLRGGRKP